MCALLLAVVHGSDDDTGVDVAVRAVVHGTDDDTDVAVCAVGHGSDDDTGVAVCAVVHSTDDDDDTDVDVAVCAVQEKGKRSQLWRMTGSGMLEHEGSVSPREPGKPRSSQPQGPVLDISDIAPQPGRPVPLVLKKPDERRRSTQMWRFTQVGTVLTMFSGTVLTLFSGTVLHCSLALFLQCSLALFSQCSLAPFF